MSSLSPPQTPERSQDPSAVETPRGWLEYEEFRGAGQRHTVVGRVLVHPAFRSPELGNKRALFVYLPPSYTLDSHRRFPVLYAQDGQNLFDEEASFAGEWRADETMEDLARTDGIEAIVVGVANAGAERIHEYSPLVEPGLSAGLGDRYVRFLVETLKPEIDRVFRTRPEAEATGLLGSSLGGLISLHAFFERPDQFGFVGAMSPSLQMGEGAFLEMLRAYPPRGGRVYLDVGTEEGARPRLGRFLFRPFSRPYPARVRAAFRILVRKGYSPGRDLVLVQDQGGRHNEADWGRRLPQALQFLLAPWNRSSSRGD